MPRLPAFRWVLPLTPARSARQAGAALRPELCRHALVRRPRQLAVRARRRLGRLTAALGLVLGLTLGGSASGEAASSQAASADSTLSVAQARNTAQLAFIYAYPMLFNYKTLYQQVLDPSSSAYIGGFGQFRHYSQPYGPENREIVTPNNDTPYSWAWLDLRREPWVVTLPKVPGKRYYVLQGIDLYTYNFAYLGSRTTGNRAGRYLFVGPHWHGTVPKGMDGVLHADSDIILLFGRVELQGAGDVSKVQAIQRGFHLMPLSLFAQRTPPPLSLAPALAFPKWDEARATSIDFIAYLNFLLSLTQPAAPSEAALLARFAKIGIAPGRPFDAAQFSPEIRQAIVDGVADAKQTLHEAALHTSNSMDLFGSRADLHDNYLKRAIGAVVGIYGNSRQEAVYIGTHQNAEHRQLVGTQPYVLHFDKQQLPPARFFWSMTLYGLPGHNLVANALQRYKLGERTPGLKYGRDGSLDIYVQQAAPSPERVANWLPAPPGAYYLIMRIYGPGPTVLDGSWQLPAPQAGTP